MTDELSTAIVELRRDEAIAMVKARVAEGTDPLAILDACRRGMTLVGERFQQGHYFLAELLLAAEIFKGAAQELEPELGRLRAAEPAGTVVLATMRGDIHDLGKNVVATLLRAHAFEVHDLGVNVTPAALVERVETIGPDFVGFSALLTTAFPSMKEAAELMAKAGIRAGIGLMVGGGVTTPAVKDYVGADLQTTDANEGVAWCLSTRKGGRRGK